MNGLIAGVVAVTERLEGFFGGTPEDSDEFIIVTEMIDKKIIEETDILITYGRLETLANHQNNEEAITNKIITNLVNLHVSLTSMN